MPKKRQHRVNAPATAAIGHRHTGALNCEEKIKICKKHETFEAIG